MPETTRRQIEEIEARRQFILAGNSRFTLVSGRTGARFTYHAKRWEKHDKVRYYISVLTPNGRLYRQDRHPNAISASAGSWRALDYLFNQGGIAHPGIEVWHEGRCGRCGRLLTVPESIASGIGPVCAERMD